MPRKNRKKSIQRLENNPDDRHKIYAAISAFVFSVINISLCLMIGFQTIIPTTFLLLFYLFLSVIGFIILKKRKTNYAALKAYIIFPLIINLLLSLNYLISFNEVKETYSFRRTLYWEYHRTNLSREPDIQTSTLIRLEHDAYKSCYGIRIFLQPENIGPTERITYTFKTGILGMKVMVRCAFP